MTINITPVGKPRMTQRDKWQQRPAVMRYRAYCDQLRAELGADYELPGKLTLEFYLPMPKSWSDKKRKEMAFKPHDQKPDVDNLIKGYMDAFKTEDKHVWKVEAQKKWAFEGEVYVG